MHFVILFLLIFMGQGLCSNNLDETETYLSPSSTEAHEAENMSMEIEDTETPPSNPPLPDLNVLEALAHYYGIPISDMLNPPPPKETITAEQFLEQNFPHFNSEEKKEALTFIRGYILAL